MGSASTGKTTSAKLISKDLKISLQPEIEDIVLNDFKRQKLIKKNNDLTPELSYRFQLLALKKRELFETAHKSFVSDRTAFDLLVFHYIYVNSTITKSRSLDFGIRCMNLVKQYDFLFLFPFGAIPLKKDGRRNTNAMYQRMIHRKFVQLLEDFNVTYYGLSEVALSKYKRVHEIFSIIESNRQ